MPSLLHVQDAPPRAIPVAQNKLFAFTRSCHQTTSFCTSQQTFQGLCHLPSALSDCLSARQTPNFTPAPPHHPPSSHNPSFVDSAEPYHLDSPSFPQAKHRKAEYTQLQLTSVRIRVLSPLQLGLCFFEEGSQGSRIGHVAKSFVRGSGVGRSTRREDGLSMS